MNRIPPIFSIRLPVLGAGIFILFLSLYSSFPSHSPLAIDQAWNGLSPEILRPETAVEYSPACQESFSEKNTADISNAAWAASGLSVFFLVVYFGSGSLIWSLWAALILGFSQFYLLLSLSPNRAMPAFALALAAVLLGAAPISRGRATAVVISALFMTASAYLFPPYIFLSLALQIIWYKKNSRDKRIDILFAVTVIACAALLTTSGHLPLRPYDYASPPFPSPAIFASLLSRLNSMREIAFRVFAAVPALTMDQQMLMGMKRDPDYLKRMILLIIFFIQFVIVCAFFSKNQMRAKSKTAAVFLCLGVSAVTAFFYGPVRASIWLPPAAGLVYLTALSAGIPASAPKYFKILRGLLFVFPLCLVLPNLENVLLARHRVPPEQILEICKAAPKTKGPVLIITADATAGRVLSWKWKSRIIYARLNMPLSPFVQKNLITRTADIRKKGGLVYLIGDPPLPDAAKILGEPANPPFSLKILDKTFKISEYR